MMSRHTRKSEIYQGSTLHLLGNLEKAKRVHFRKQCLCWRTQLCEYPSGDAHHRLSEDGGSSAQNREDSHPDTRIENETRQGKHVRWANLTNSKTSVAKETARHLGYYRRVFLLSRGVHCSRYTGHVSGRVSYRVLTTPLTPSALATFGTVFPRSSITDDNLKTQPFAWHNSHGNPVQRSGTSEANKIKPRRSLPPSTHEDRLPTSNASHGGDRVTSSRTRA